LINERTTRQQKEKAKNKKIKTHTMKRSTTQAKLNIDGSKQDDHGFFTLD
jgi:hypothetical protein